MIRTARSDEISRMGPPRFLPVLLAFCMFSTGASGLVNEYVLATMTTYILGNSIEQFSIIIAAMMLMMGVSGLAQRSMSDDHLIVKFMGLEIIMALSASIAPLAIYAAFAYFNDHFIFVHYFFVLVIGFLIGFEIPLVMRIIEQYKVTLKTNLALVYAMDYIGAFIGAMIWVKLLLVYFPLAKISFIVAGFNFLVAALTILYFIRTGVIQRPWWPVVLLAGTSLFLVFGLFRSVDLSHLLEQRFYDDPIIHKETSRYQHLVLTHDRAKDDLRLYINGNTQFSSVDEARYHELLTHPVMSLKPEARHVLVLGGGDGLALREILKYPTVEKITVIDLDPAVVHLAATHPQLRALNRDAFADARVLVDAPEYAARYSVQDVYARHRRESKPEWVAAVDVFHVDADRFLNVSHDHIWDVAILDFPDPGSVELAKLYSRQFYAKLAAHLADDALVAVQSTSPFHAKSAFLAVGNTLRASGFEALPYRQNIPSFGDWGFYLAWKDERSVDQIKQALHGVTGFSVDTAFLTPALMHASFAFGKHELFLDKGREACINSVMNPCLFTHYVRESWRVP